MNQYDPVLGFKFTQTDKFNVVYHSPRRKIGNLREEFNNDAINLSKNLGPVYIAFSSGIDSQIILRCFLDMKLDAEFVFLHCKGYNELEFQRVKQCEKFYGITVRIIEIDINQFQDQWLKESKGSIGTTILGYPFRYMSQQLQENWPLVMQGKAEPAIVGTRRESASVYHSNHETMELRFDLLKKHRQIFDFPASPEAIASYYTDDNLKTFISNIMYFTDGISPSDHLQLFNTHAKPFVKGKYFKDDVIWFGKLRGNENFPNWMMTWERAIDSVVSVPYWDLVDFLENTVDSEKIYNEWIYKNYKRE